MVLLMGKPIAKVVLRFLFGGQGNWYRDGYTNLMIHVSRVSSPYYQMDKMSHHAKYCSQI